MKIISSYCYENYLLLSTFSGEYILYDLNTSEKINEIKIGNLPAFFSLDSSMGSLIFGNSYDQENMIIGELPNIKLLSLPQFEFGNINYVTNTNKGMLIADGTGSIKLFNPNDCSMEILETNEFLYPEMIIEYKGNNGSFFKKGSYYSCWRTANDFPKGKIKKLGGGTYDLLFECIAIAFCNNILFAIEHDLEKTKLYLIDCMTDKVLSNFILRDESIKSIFPFPSIYSNGNIVLLEYNNDKYILTEECYHDIDKCFFVENEKVVLFKNGFIIFSVKDDNIEFIEKRIV